MQESEEDSIEALKLANAPDPHSVVRDLDGDDSGDAADLPGGEILDAELTVQVIPQREDEFVCQSCFLVRHKSQKAREKDGLAYCKDCEG